MSDPYDSRSSSGPRAAGIILALLWIVGVAAFAIWWFWPFGGGNGQNPNAQPRQVAARGDLSELEKTNISIYDTASPSVVHVTNLAVASSGLFNLDVQQVPKGTGSGFIWDDQGHIVTNYHVVNGAQAASVTLADHTTYQADQIWADPDNDIAVLWINVSGHKLTPIMLGSSHDLKVGQLTYAIGNPFGLDHTMTYGIVSALGREIETDSGRPIRGAIQTNAAINPGNSGGPLLDSAARLIGMNTAILSPSGAFAGIGFAIPVDDINRIVPELIQHGKIVRPKLGVQIATDQVAHQMGVTKGALIVKVVPNGPAADAGLKGVSKDANGNIHMGDVITAFNGEPINNVSDLYAALDKVQPGKTATLKIMRDGQSKDVSVTLQARE